MTWCFDRNNSDSTASLKWQKSPETTMDKQDVRKFAPYAVPCNVFKILKGSFRNLTLSHTTRDAFMNYSFASTQDASLGCLCYLKQKFNGYVERSKNSSSSQWVYEYAVLFSTGHNHTFYFIRKNPRPA